MKITQRAYQMTKPDCPVDVIANSLQEAADMVSRGWKCVAHLTTIKRVPDAQGAAR